MVALPVRVKPKLFVFRWFPVNYSRVEILFIKICPFHAFSNTFSFKKDPCAQFSWLLWHFYQDSKSSLKNERVQCANWDLLNYQKKTKNSRKQVTIVNSPFLKFKKQTPNLNSAIIFHTEREFFCLNLSSVEATRKNCI